MKYSSSLYPQLVSPRVYLLNFFCYELYLNVGFCGWLVTYLQACLQPLQKFSWSKAGSTRALITWGKVLEVPLYLYQCIKKKSL